MYIKLKYALGDFSHIGDANIDTPNATDPWKTQNGPTIRKNINTSGSNIKTTACFCFLGARSRTVGEQDKRPDWKFMKSGMYMNWMCWIMQRHQQVNAQVYDTQ